MVKWHPLTPEKTRVKTKLQEFIKRNKTRNAHLYNDSLVEGHDYVVCPISNERMSMIKDNYISNVLGMKVEDYPKVKRICDKRKDNIKHGLNQIDLVTGLSKYELGQTKARKILAEIGSDGLCGYDRKGQKTRATHMSNIDEFGRNGYRRQADARLTTILPSGLTVEQNAHIKQKETLIKTNKSGTGGASYQSKKALRPLLNYLIENNIKYYFDKTEYGIKDYKTGNYYFWDLTLPEYKIAIEYQSNAWHADPMLSADKWLTWKTPRGKVKTPEEVLAYDYEKARALYRNREMRTYFVWESTQDENIKELLCLLKTPNMKY